MAGIDRMISSSLISQIKKNLDLDIFKKSGAGIIFRILDVNKIIYRTFSCIFKNS